MQYRRCGVSGLKLPAISLGLWQNFGDDDKEEDYKKILTTAFDNGITHFDLANNYGPPPGSAETNFGKQLKKLFSGNTRDELIISTKAGYTMWDGPYGDWGSRKFLISSLDQSLSRMKLDYVDIFYHHRPDPETPLEETMGALSHIVKQGKALYVGISNYNSDEATRAISLLKESGTPCVIHQPKYSMFQRAPEQGLLNVLEQNGVGCIPFSPLAQGLLTNKYLNGIGKESRASREGSLQTKDITPELLKKITFLNGIAIERNQSLAQMALAWVLRHKQVTSVLVGASRASQLKDSLGCLDNLHFSGEELTEIDKVLSGTHGS